MRRRSSVGERIIVESSDYAPEAVSREVASFSPRTPVGSVIFHSTHEGRWRVERTDNGWSISRVPESTTPRKGVADPAIGALATDDG